MAGQRAGRRSRGQREALAHLLHPDAFEPIVSLRIKQQIVAGLGHLAGATDDVDEALAGIRAALTAEHGEGFWFIDPPVAARWRSPARSPAAPP